MESVVVTLKRIGTMEVKDLTLPVDIPVRLLFPILCEVFKSSINLLETIPDEKAYLLVEQTGRKINATETLTDADVLPGDLLAFNPDIQLPGEVPYVTSAQPGFAAPNGLFHEIRTPVSLLGRSDPDTGLFPSDFTVDLALIDLAQKSTRRHAQVKWIGKSFYIQDLGSKNGTFINNEKLSKDERYLLKDGDIIRLGEQGILLRFQIGSKAS